MLKVKGPTLDFTFVTSLSFAQEQTLKEVTQNKTPEAVAPGVLCNSL